MAVAVGTPATDSLEGVAVESTTTHVESSALTCEVDGAWVAATPTAIATEAIKPAAATATRRLIFTMFPP